MNIFMKMKKKTNLFCEINDDFHQHLVDNDRLVAEIKVIFPLNFLKI